MNRQRNNYFLLGLIGGLTVITIVIWISIATYQGLVVDTVSGELSTYLNPLQPNLNSHLLDVVQSRRALDTQL